MEQQSKGQFGSAELIRVYSTILDSSRTIRRLNLPTLAAAGEINSARILLSPPPP
jgi:hypothetical protein